MHIKLNTNIDEFERRLNAISTERLRAASAQAVTNAAFAARKSIISKLPDIFDRPTPLTMHSIIVDKADPSGTGPIRATVRVRDEVSKGIAPASYLLHAAEGGVRPFKSSERALTLKGLMSASDQLVPGVGAKLDQFGSVSGSTMQSILSRIGALGEQGYTANATARTIKRLKKKGIAVTRKSGTDYFVAHSRRDGEPLGIYQLIGPGHVEPVLWFVNRRPQYRARFPFRDLVAEAAHEVLSAEFLKAVLFQLRSA